LECHAVVFSESDNHCSFFENISVRKCHVGEPCERSGWVALEKSAQQILESSSAGKSVLTLQDKITNLERDVGVILLVVAESGGKLAPAIDAINTMNSKVSDVDTPVKETHEIINLITDVLKGVEQVPEVGTVLKQTRLRYMLEKIDDVIVDVKRPLDAVNRVLQTAVGPFVVVEDLLLALGSYLSLLSPATFLRTLTTFLLRIVLCAETLGSQAVVSSVNTIVEDLGILVDDLQRIVNVVKDVVVSSITTVVNDVVNSLNGVIQGANNFVQAIYTAWDVLRHQFPFTILPKLMEQVLVAIPKIGFEWKDYKIDILGYFSFTISLPKISIAGDFCIWLGPAVSMFNSLKNELPWGLEWAFDLVEKAFSEVLNVLFTPVFSLIGATPNIDLGKSRACGTFGKPCCDPGQSNDTCTSDCLQIKIGDIVEIVKQIGDIISQFSAMEFLMEKFNGLIKEPLQKLFSAALLPTIDTDFAKNLLTGVEDKIKAGAKDVTDKMKEIAEAPFNFMKELESKLLPLLDQLPCDLGDFLIDLIDGSSPATATTPAQLFGNQVVPGSQRQLQQQRCFEAIIPSSSATLATILKEINKALSNENESTISNKETSTKVIRKNYKKEISELREEVTPRAISFLHTWFTDPVYLFDPNNLSRAGYGATVFVHPTPNTYRDRNNKENNRNAGNSDASEAKFLLLSYVRNNQGNSVNQLVCVNKVKDDDGSILPYNKDRQKSYNKEKLLEYFLSSGLPSDYVMPIRVDFPIEQWATGKLPKVPTFGLVSEIVLQVVEESADVLKNKIKTVDCCGCHPDAGCFKQAEVNFEKITALGTTQTTNMDTPKITQPFMALYGGIRSKQIFFDPRTFGFYLSQEKRPNFDISFGREKNGNTYQNKCYSDDNFDQTSAFRRLIAGVEMNKVPSGIKNFINAESAPCKYNYELDSKGIVTRYELPRSNEKQVGGTLWATTSSNTVTPTFDLMKCDNDGGYNSNKCDVEHIIEKATLEQDPTNEYHGVGQFPTVDFVMSWAVWNKANGALFPNQPGDANDAKKLLYGESIYNCVDSILKAQCGYPVKDKTGWRSEACENAKQDVTKLKGEFYVV